MRWSPVRPRASASPLRMRSHRTAPISCSTASATKPRSKKSAPVSRRSFGVKAVYSPADMTKPAEIADMIRATERNSARLDVLVNNAGIQHVAQYRGFPDREMGRDHRDQPLGRRSTRSAPPCPA